MDNIFPLHITEQTKINLLDSIENWKVLYNIFKDEHYLKNIERDKLALEILSGIIKKQVYELDRQMVNRVNYLQQQPTYGTSV